MSDLSPLEQRTRDLVEQITLTPGSLLVVRLAPDTPEADARALWALLHSFFAQLPYPVHALLLPGNVGLEQVPAATMAALGWHHVEGEDR